jgi:hypothetical protein
MGIVLGFAEWEVLKIPGQGSVDCCDDAYATHTPDNCRVCFLMASKSARCIHNVIQYPKMANQWFLLLLDYVFFPFPSLVTEMLTSFVCWCCSCCFFMLPQV